MRRQGIFAKVLFMDVILSMLVCVMAIVQLLKVETPQEKRKNDTLETDGLYAIVVSWPTASNDDVDLYVQDPSKNLIFYNQTTAELMHLEFDDRGELGDKAMTSSGEVKVDINRERAIIRGGMAGEYVVNVQMYAKRHPAPTTVTITLYGLKGDDKEILSKTRVLKAEGEEATAFRFKLSTDGAIVETNELPISLIGQAASSAPPQGGFGLMGGAR